MAVVNALQIKNLRSLVDTGWIEQKPITILVGTNSAGKSTFARVFPLLRQSVGERKQSPILWFGQYVDFGQFSVAVHNKNPSAPICFGFRLSILPTEVERLNPAFYLNRSSRDSVDEKPFSLDAEIFLVQGAEEGAADTLIDKLVLRVLGFTVTVKFSGEDSIESMTVDGLELWTDRPTFLSHVIFDSVLPKFSFYKERRVEGTEKDDGDAIYLDDFDPYSEVLVREIRKHVHGNLGVERVRQIASRLTFSEGNQFAERAYAAGVDQRMWTDHIKSASLKPGGLRTLQRAVLCARLPGLLRLVDSALLAHFSAVRYIEPLRATAQRYYRKQDLAVGELDAKGANVAQFLQSLPYWRRNEFEEISRRLFGFAVKPRVQGGHIELVLEQTEGGSVVNLADAGVGFSQMLPILLQFWASDSIRADHKTRASAGAYTTLVVEQPELHLHPAYQAKLANLFCETASGKRGNRTRIVAETHSPALINRLGSLVADGDFDPKDIQILLFEQEGQEAFTKLTIASFDSDGVLSNWPFGFFEPEA